MKGSAMKRLRILLAPLLVCVIAAVALAQSGGGYDLSWNTIAGGGGTSSGGNYAMNGVIGQHGVGGPPPQGNKFLVNPGGDGPPLVPSTSTPTPTRTATRSLPSAWPIPYPIASITWRRCAWPMPQMVWSGWSKAAWSCSPPPARMA